VAQVLTTLYYDLEDPSGDVVLHTLEKQAKVRVNPAYGSWHPGTSLVGVVTPSTSSATPLGSSGSQAGSAGDSLPS
jgi:hypothetical protein